MKMGTDSRDVVPNSASIRISAKPTAATTRDNRISKRSMVYGIRCHEVRPRILNSTINTAYLSV